MREDHNPNDSIGHFEKVEEPYFYYEILRRIMEEEGEGIEKKSVTKGFEDVFDEPLGAGQFYNTGTTPFQLATVLSLAPSPRIKEIIKNGAFQNSAEVIKALRQGKVLSGMKLMDLACGVLPYFALAARALGAEVYMSDVEKPRDAVPGFIQADLNNAAASEILLQFSGGSFDIVSENIVDLVPGMSNAIRKPKPETICAIGEQLLKKGGYLDHTLGIGAREILRKN